MGAISWVRAAVATAVAGLLGLGIVGSALPSSGAVAGTEDAGHVRQYRTFASLDDMTRASDLVIRGTVLAIKPGRTFSGESGGVAFFEVSVGVDMVLRGTFTEATIDLEVDNGLFPEIDTGRGAWPIEGTQTVLFLHQKVDRPAFWRPVSSQGAYTIQSGSLIAADPVDKFANVVARIDLVTLEDAVRGP